MRKRSSCPTTVILLLVTCSTCFIFAVLYACQALCCGSPPPRGIARKHNDAYRVTAHGVAVAAARSAASPWWRKRNKQEVRVGTDASRAKAEAKAAMEQELRAQTKIRAALTRQARRHKDFVKQLEAEGWHLSAADRIARGSLRQGRERMDAFLKSDEYVRQRQTRRDRMHGRGIIMAAGGPVPLANAYVSLHMLRNVHSCSLPIELFYNGPYELDNVTRTALEREFDGLRCINIADFKAPPHQVFASDGHVLSRQQNGWVLKAQMLSASSFEEVLMLDADNVPLADPAFLFESPEYRASGNLFWPDFWSSNWHNPGPVYTLLNLTEPWDEQPDLLTTESGQLLLDRRRFDEVLEWVMFLNLHADMVYAVIWGDKDTYRLAFSLAGQSHSFAQVNQHPANALRMPQQEKGSDASQEAQAQRAYSHAGMLQMAPSGKMLFLHRTAGSKLDPYTDYAPDFQALDFITPPLSPRQAAQVHITGPMGVAKFDASTAGTCVASQPLNLVQAADECKIAGNSSLQSWGMAGVPPIPLFGVADFPGLPDLMLQSMGAFWEVQRQFRNRTMPLGTPH